MTSETLDIKNELGGLLDEFFLAVKLKPCALVVLGCSTSEISGGVIGKNSVVSTGEVIARVFFDKCKEYGFTPAVQCCEHLNRALVIEREEAERRSFELVSAVPHAKAGGSTAAAFYRLLVSPALVESITADAGIDIGDTFVGMHLKKVAVPLRLSKRRLGGANITFAFTRPKYIGGERAMY